MGKLATVFHGVGGSVRSLTGWVTIGGVLANLAGGFFGWTVTAAAVVQWFSAMPDWYFKFPATMTGTLIGVLIGAYGYDTWRNIPRLPARNDNNKPERSLLW